jgi:putative membrane protein
MREFLIRWFVTSIAIFIVANIFKVVYIEDLKALIIGALVLGILNAILRPILVFLTLPINILTLGVFLLVINGFILALVGFIVPGFEIKSFWNAFWGALLISIISALINFVIKNEGKVQIHFFKSTKN